MIRWRRSLFAPRAKVGHVPGQLDVDGFIGDDLDRELAPGITVRDIRRALIFPTIPRPR